MTSRLKLVKALVVAASAAACSAELSDAADGSATGTNEKTTTPSGNGDGGLMAPVTNAFKPTAEQARQYMQYLGPAILGRVLSEEEIAKLDAQAGDAIKPMLTGWVEEVGFAESIRIMMELKLGTSGQRGSVDYGLAGYLVRHVVQNKMPWSTILTSNTCYDKMDAPIPCDTGAPYTAGVLTTRGFLAGNESRFNLARAHAMLSTFMCRDYPHEDTLQPRVDKPQLKLMFRAESVEDQQVAEAAGGFGNGFACYTCHGQFSLHAQPFVKFDKAGLYQPNATGVQSTTGQLGESDGGLAASHWESPELAKLESASWFTHPVANLAEGAGVIASDPNFKQCTLQHLLDMGLGLSPSYDAGIKGLKVDPAFLAEVASSITALEPDPTIQSLAIAIYSAPRVIATTLNGLKR